MVVLRLRGDALHRQGGATVMLRSLLRVLLTRTEHVPMRQGALEAAEAALEQPIDTRERHVPGFAILEFLEAVEVPVLVLCGEAQSLFLPTIGGKPDTCGAEYTRDSFLKQLLVYGSHTTLRCITGSSMAHTWVNLADMPTYGHPVITSASAPDLPVTYSSRHMHLAWELLQGQFPHVPSDPKLLQLCPPSVALLTALVTSWINAGHPEDAVAFVDESVRAKLVGESRKDWKLALEGLPTSERLAVLDMASPAVGARIEHLHFGLRRFLQPHVDDKEDGSCFFRDAHQRQIMRLLLNKDGTLRESWSDLEFSATLMQLDGGWNLFYLGEAADYLLGPNASRRWEHEEPPAELDEFKAVMQAIANMVADKLKSDLGGAALSPRELWERQPWFRKLLLSKWNDRGREVYKANTSSRCTHLDMLVFHLRLCRNVLASMKPWNLEHGVAVDVDVVEALPGVLGQSLVDFNEVMIGALRVLSRRTVEDATAGFGAQLLGGGSRVVGVAEEEGSGEGGSSSSTGRQQPW